MEKKSRSIIGWLTIILGFVWIVWFFFYLLPQLCTLPIYNDALFRWGMVVLIFWIFKSLAVKLIMIVGKKAKLVNYLSILLFLAGSVILWIVQPQLSAVFAHFNVVSTFLCMLFFTSWFVVDVVDIFDIL